MANDADNRDHLFSQTISGQEAAFAELRQAASAPVRDMRAQAGVRHDRVWSTALSEVEKIHGRRPSVEMYDQDAEGAVWLRLAQEAGSEYIGLAVSPATPASVVEAAEGEFWTAVRRWISYVTKEFLSAAAYSKKQREEKENW